MLKKWGISAAALLLTGSVVLSGCGSSADKEPKEALQAATGQLAALTSYEVETKMVINNLTIDVPAESADMGMTTQVLGMLRDAEFTVSGVYQAEPMQTEMTLVLNLKGDMAMTFTIPMIMTSEKLYVKIPSIPMVPLPENLVNKFVELDFRELAELEGIEYRPDMFDPQTSQQLMNDLSGAVLGEYDQQTYFENVKPSDAVLPEGVSAEQVVRFQVTNNNVKDAIVILFKQALPKMIDVLSKEEYKDLLQLDDTQLAEAKENLQSEENLAEMEADLEELDRYLTINQFQVNTAIDSNDFPVYQDVIMDILINDPDDGTTVGLAMTGSNHYKSINKQVEFPIGIPSGENVVTMEELEQMFGGGMSTY